MAPSVKGGCALGAGQVGGYVEQYRGLTFATVRNAGHMVRHPAVPLLCKQLGSRLLAMEVYAPLLSSFTARVGLF